MKSANQRIVIRTVTLVFAVHAISAAGCSDQRSNIATVSGEVTIDGKPVSEGDIRFYPAQGRMAIGEIVDGKYSLRTFGENDGAIVGQHKVTVKALITKPRRMPKFNPPPDATPAQIKELEVEMMEQLDMAFVWIVPENYSRIETSPLTAEVKPGENPINFSLTSN